MIISKCCHGCGMAFERSQLTKGFCPWCSSYQTDKRMAIFTAAAYAVAIVVMVVGLTWLMT